MLLVFQIDAVDKFQQLVVVPAGKLLTAGLVQQVGRPG